MPTSISAYTGLEQEEGLREQVCRAGARTAPTREHGGNIDLGALGAGSKLHLVS